MGNLNIVFMFSSWIKVNNYNVIFGTGCWQNNNLRNIWLHKTWFLNIFLAIKVIIKLCLTSVDREVIEHPHFHSVHCNCHLTNTENPELSWWKLCHHGAVGYHNDNLQCHQWRTKLASWQLWVYAEAVWKSSLLLSTPILQQQENLSWQTVWITPPHYL